MARKKRQSNETKILSEPLAIIGMNCQFPGVDGDIEDVSSFHDLLIQGQSPVKEVPENRWDCHAYYDADRKKADKIVNRQGGFLKNPHLFDAAFFKISPAEAKQIDPQHRLFLEVSIRALNHANLSLDSLEGSNTGVYCGISTHDYNQLNIKDKITFNEYTQIGTANSAAAGRLCHFLNLTGPAMAVDTACSSSLSALYLAAISLETGQCRTAVVGGVHLNLCPENFIGLTKANMLSATGKCHSFDSRADGFVRSEGCGVVIVKRLSDAIKDNDTIHAVVKSVVMNQNGGGTSLPVPNKKSQIAMHQAALEQAGLTPADIDYIESHGTGTVIGDTVELQAIEAVHQGYHCQDNPLIIGALKSNLGHCISASGVASLIKVICALKQECIPPNLHYSCPNQSIDPASIPAVMPVQPTGFAKHQTKKRYGQITNFGFTGTNVCAIVEEPPEIESKISSTDRDVAVCFVVSAQSEASLKHLMKKYTQYLKRTSTCLADICYTLINCRDHYKYRCAIIAKDKDALIRKIEAQDYEMKSVPVQKAVRKIKGDATSIYEQFFSGANIKLEAEAVKFNKADLPLYCFDRKPYWHESKTNNGSTHWLDTLSQQSREQQLETIKTKVALVIQTILQSVSAPGKSEGITKAGDNPAFLEKGNIDAHLDFETLGFNQSLLAVLDKKLQETLAPRFKLPATVSALHLTLDKQARYLQQIIIPPVVSRQPAINVLNLEPIAIIGMSCRLPRAANIDEFLALLENGESGMTDIPLDRWDNAIYYDADMDALGRLYIKQLGLIDPIKDFDAEFFNISPREARLMSPQLRVFLETSYHAIEDANLSLDLIKDSNTGVFVGCGTNEYPKVMFEQGIVLEELNIYFATGNVLNALAGRVAYAFDFHGPIQAIDTACSSSMTAIHNACLSLQSGDCNMAVAGGVNILLTPDSNITLSKARMLSPDSRCKTFSDDADGYARSEGCGAVVLKRLSDAIKDGDIIQAIIKGSSANSDGKSGGFTVPNGIAQEEVIRSALAKAKLSPADIDFIEAHGTGTPLADPIEANTLNRIFSEHHSQDNPFYISSVKTNIGHCESASGVSSVIKAVLSLQKQKLFKHLNFKKLNPAIELGNAVIPLQNLPWRKEHAPRNAGVSSFGFSGANVHMVLQQAPARKAKVRQLPDESLLVLSAKSKTALECLLASYQRYLRQTPEPFADICYTAATCRGHFLFRVAIKAGTATEAAAIIEKKAFTIYSIVTTHPLRPAACPRDPYDLSKIPGSRGQTAGRREWGEQLHFINKEKDLVQQPLTLEQLQSAYQTGCIIDWPAYYQSLGCSFDKVKLPLYEFDRKEYWVGYKDKLKDALIADNWCYQLRWEKKPCEKNNSKETPEPWLLIGDRQLASGFKGQGLQTVLEEEDYELDTLGGIIFATALDSPSSADIDLNIDFQKKCVKKLLDLVKNLHQKAVSLPLIVLTHNGIAELANDNINISNSPLIGFCKTLVLELPQFNTVVIDSDTNDNIRLAVTVREEIKHNHGSNYEHIVAWRGGKRYVSRLYETTLKNQKKSLYDEGRYLITGGSGGLGLVSAQALLSAGARELILVARNVEKPLIKKAIKKIRSYYPGRDIRTVSLDVTDKEELGRFLADINADGLLKGIIHAAGAAIKAPLIDHQAEDVDYLFLAKVKGGWYLHELSKDFNLDFFVVYSSIASVFGSNKESVYSAANSFLDALIAQRRTLGLVGTSVQWGPWGETGMAQSLSRGQNLKQALIHNDQGHAFLKILINEQLDHLSFISPDYLKFMLEFVPAPLPGFHQHLVDNLTIESAETNANLSPWLRQYQTVSSDKQLGACKEMVNTICKAILELTEIEELDEDEGFFEIGFDSLMIIELAGALKKNLDPVIKVAVNIGFDYPTINKLAHYIVSELDEHLMARVGSPPSLQPADDSIAVIGMSGTFPGAPDIAAFERLLEEGRSGMKDIPLERWDNSKYYEPGSNQSDKSCVNKLGLIEDIKAFDAEFFGISPREAKLMDPQQRIFLECCYLALENANYRPESVRGSLTGVFAGVGNNEYYTQLLKSSMAAEERSVLLITGNSLNLVPGRVSYTFDFKGPSIALDTACSSSMVAIHNACQSLKKGEIDYAMAGGVNVLLLPESNITLTNANALSPDGQCKTFDESADGYARSEGCGVIFLKRLADAKRDGDNILAVIKGSAVNNDGKAAGLTVPNGQSQEAVMEKALSQARLSASDISYVEAHGTGTPLGDPVEVHAINKVYGNQRDKNNPLYIGTVKTNIGHLESAAGVAAVIKTIIGLNKKKIYKHRNFKKLNPEIHLNDTRIALENTDWNTPSNLKCAAVNAFGFSGTNANVIVQEYVSDTEQRLPQADKIHALVLSARSKSALDNLANRYQSYLQTTTAEFGDICFTAATCRAHYPYRLAVIAASAVQANRFLAMGRFVLSGDQNNVPDLPQDTVLHSLLTDYLRGEPLDWSFYYQNCGDKYTKVALPNYVFDRSVFWTDLTSDIVTHKTRMHPLLGQMLSMPGNEFLFSNKLDRESLIYIEQHRVFDKVVFPAAAYIELGLAAGKALYRNQRLRIENFNIERPMYPKLSQELQIQARPKHETCHKINIYARENAQWQQFCEMEVAAHSPNPGAYLQNPESFAGSNGYYKPTAGGRESAEPLQTLMHAETLSAPESVNIDRLKSSFADNVNRHEIYEAFDNIALFYGDAFRVLQEGYIRADSVLTKVALTNTSSAHDYYCHPVLLDGAMQSILLFGMSQAAKTATYVPYAFRRMTAFQKIPGNLWVHVIQQNSKQAKELCVDLKLYDNSGLLTAHIEQLKLRAVTRDNFTSHESLRHHLYHICWTQPVEFRQRDEPLAQSREKLPEPTKLPEFVVISPDAAKAEKRLGHLDYQLVQDVGQFVEIDHKNIIFIYEQEQFDTLFEFCQRLFRARPASFILVTENACAIKAGEVINPYHTMAGAFWETFRKELDLAANYRVDLESEGDLHAALTFLFNPDSRANQLAIRDTLYIPQLKKKQISNNPEAGDTLYDSNASYLITGGTGGLASALMEYLIRRGVRHIHITSRTACPDETKALMENARQRGVSISHYAADVSNHRQMEKVMADIDQSGKPLKGVFHLAGVVHDGLIVNLSEKALADVFRAKRDGALILHQLTINRQLDWFVLYSSSASVLGAKGQANYAAANGFLDGLAHLRQQQALPAIAINWGPFHAIGMTAKLTGTISQQGFIPLDKDSIDILDVLLPSGLPQIVPCPVDWGIYLQYAPNQSGFSRREKSAFVADLQFFNILRQRNREECTILLSQALCEITADVLELGDDYAIGVNDSLYAMGLNSLMAIEIRNRIHDKLQCQTLSLSIEYFINDPTIGRIAANIAGELQKHFGSPTHPASVQYAGKETLAVCDFQYIFWALNKLNYSFNIGMQVQLHGKLDKNYLYQAFDFVIKKNSAFWINFSENTPTQTICLPLDETPHYLRCADKMKDAEGCAATPEMVYQDISLANDPGLLNREYYNNMMRFIPLTQQPLIRAFLYKINNDWHELHIVIPHIIVDDTSCAIVWRQLMESYAKLALGQKLIPAPATDSYFNFVRLNNQHYQTNLAEKKNFWRNYNRGFKKLYFGDKYHLPDASRNEKHLHHYPIAAPLVEKFMQWHKQRNLNISTGLVAACQLAFYKISKQKKIPVILIHSGREGSQNKSTVGLFSEYKRINLSFEKHCKFIDCIQSIEKQLLQTAPYQKCSHFIKDKGLKISKSPIFYNLINKTGKLFSGKPFHESSLNPEITEYYFEYLSLISWRKKSIAFKNWLNKWFNLNLPLLKPARLRVLISITPSLFSKESPHQSFANLQYSYPGHLACMDRPVGNQTLWIYFSKKGQGEYCLSINGPLTIECKNAIAREFNKILSEFEKTGETKLQPSSNSGEPKLYEK